jgi:hypothetical protein
MVMVGQGLQKSEHRREILAQSRLIGKRFCRALAIANYALRITHYAFTFYVSRFTPHFFFDKPAQPC